jgi:hypothetical protein
VSGVGTIKGITFQTVQALSDVVDLVVEGHGEAVTIEGADDVVDYEVLDRDGRPVAVRQAKARQEPGTWGANELAKILCAWGQVGYADTTEFAFVTDASLSDSGQRLQDLIKEMQLHPDEEVLRKTAASFRGGVQLPSLEVLRRVQILTRMGTPETVLARVEMRILALLSRARLATLEDAASAANALLRKLFIIGGSPDLGAGPSPERRSWPPWAWMRRACRATWPGRRTPLRPIAPPSPSTASRVARSCPSTWCRRLLLACCGCCTPPTVPGQRRAWTPCWGSRQQHWWERPEKASQRHCGAWPGSRHSRTWSLFSLRRPGTPPAPCRSVCDTESRRC